MTMDAKRRRDWDRRVRAAEHNANAIRNALKTGKGKLATRDYIAELQDEEAIIAAAKLIHEYEYAEHWLKAHAGTGPGHVAAVHTWRKGFTLDIGGHGTCESEATPTIPAAVDAIRKAEGRTI